MSSTAAAAEPSAPAAADDDMMQSGVKRPLSMGREARRRLIGALHVCGQSSPIDEDRQPIPVHYVATEGMLGEVMLLSLPLSLSQSLSLSLLSFVVAIVMV